MRTNIIFEVLGEPQAQMRHRHFQRGKFRGTYDPSQDKKNDFLSIIQEKAPKQPLDGAILLNVVFYMGRPKGHYRSGKNSDMLKDDAPEWHTSKKDLDNMVKFITDAMNGIFYRDDSQISWIDAQKMYSERPRTIISIKTLE
jgi:Holliday junction resolvase RusA-like endonuclease